MQMKRTLIMLGKSPATLELAKGKRADEYWGTATIRGAWDGPLDRIYELHPIWMLQDKNYNLRHWEYLTTHDHDYQVWMQEALPEVQRSRRYPINSALALAYNIKRDDQKHAGMFTSTFDYMMAHAILEAKWERIELYGLDFAMETEYRYQRPGASAWIGFAASRGIEVYLPDGCQLLKGKLYGWEGAQVISRHKLEQRKLYYTEKEETTKGRVNRQRGIVQERLYDLKRKPSQGKEKRLQQAQQEFDQMLAQMYMYAGARLEIEQQIDTCDLNEPDDWDLNDPYRHTPVEGANNGK